MDVGPEIITGNGKKERGTTLGWHYLSNATCLMRPPLFHVRCVVSWITMICYIVRRF